MDNCEESFVDEVRSFFEREHTNCVAKKVNEDSRPRIAEASVVVLGEGGSVVSYVPTLHKWFPALRRARLNKELYHQSYVVFPERYTSQVYENFEAQIIFYGLGLCTYSQDDGLVAVIEAPFEVN